MNIDIRNLQKWLNEEQEAPIDRQALARVLAMAEQPAQRKPLTDDRVWLEYMQLWPFRPNDEPTLAKDILRFARALEAAHGIKEKNT